MKYILASSLLLLEVFPVNSLNLRLKTSAENINIVTPIAEEMKKPSIFSKTDLSPQCSKVKLYHSRLRNFIGRHDHAKENAEKNVSSKHLNAYLSRFREKADEDIAKVMAVLEEMKGVDEEKQDEMMTAVISSLDPFVQILSNPLQNFDQMKSHVMGLMEKSMPDSPGLYGSGVAPNMNGITLDPAYFPIRFNYVESAGREFNGEGRWETLAQIYDSIMVFVGETQNFFAEKHGGFLGGFGGSAPYETHSDLLCFLNMVGGEINGFADYEEQENAYQLLNIVLHNYFMLGKNELLNRPVVYFGDYVSAAEVFIGNIGVTKNGLLVQIKGKEYTKMKQDYIAFFYKYYV